MVCLTIEYCEVISNNIKSEVFLYLKESKEEKNGEVMTVLQLMTIIKISVKSMKQKRRFTRTKSQCRQQPPRQVNNASNSTYMKFKPFSQECTLDHIHEKLQSFRNTMTHQPTHERRNSEQTTPLVVRLRSIIGGKRGKGGRRNNLTQMDIRSSDHSHFSQNLDEKYKRLNRLKQRSSMSRINLKQSEAAEESSQPLPLNTISHVRHDLSQQAIDEQNAFFDMLHKPKSSILLANFNKNNCFLFSRSKHKVFAIEQEKGRKPIEIRENSNKFQSFGTYFYGSYMKKYVERRKLLGKKGTLIKMVAK